MVFLVNKTLSLPLGAINEVFLFILMADQGLFYAPRSPSLAATLSNPLAANTLFGKIDFSVTSIEMVENDLRDWRSRFESLQSELSKYYDAKLKDDLMWDNLQTMATQFLLIAAVFMIVPVLASRFAAAWGASIAGAALAGEITSLMLMTALSIWFYEESLMGIESSVEALSEATTAGAALLAGASLGLGILDLIGVYGGPALLAISQALNKAYGTENWLLANLGARLKYHLKGVPRTSVLLRAYEQIPTAPARLRFWRRAPVLTSARSLDDLVARTRTLLQMADMEVSTHSKGVLLFMDELRSRTGQPIAIARRPDGTLSLRSIKKEAEVGPGGLAYFDESGFVITKEGLTEEGWEILSPLMREASEELETITLWRPDTGEGCTVRGAKGMSFKNHGENIFAIKALHELNLEGLRRVTFNRRDGNLVFHMVDEVGESLKLLSNDPKPHLANTWNNFIRLSEKLKEAKEKGMRPAARDVADHYIAMFEYFGRQREIELQDLRLRAMHYDLQDAKLASIPRAQLEKITNEMMSTFAQSNALLAKIKGEEKPRLYYATSRATAKNWAGKAFEDKEVIRWLGELQTFAEQNKMRNLLVDADGVDGGPLLKLLKESQAAPQKREAFESFFGETRKEILRSQGVSPDKIGKIKNYNALADAITKNLHNRFSILDSEKHFMIDMDQALRELAKTGKGDVPISFFSERPFCPHCDASLDVWYQRVQQRVNDGIYPPSVTIEAWHEKGGVRITFTKGAETPHFQAIKKAADRGLPRFVTFAGRSRAHSFTPSLFVPNRFSIAWHEGGGQQLTFERRQLVPAN